MRKESLVIFVISIVLTLGIVSGLHYFYLQNQKVIPEQSLFEPKPREVVNTPLQPRLQKSKSIRGQTAKIIKCTKANGTVFWTNASRCENADLDNTLSIYDHAEIAPPVKSDNNARSSSKQTSRQTRNSLKPIPRSMTNACSFPIGKARKIERRSLSLKLDPSDSVWKDSYCRWVCDARSEGCEDVDSYLDLGHLCPEQAFVNNVLCMD